MAWFQDGSSYWKCRCDCGTIKTIKGSRLRVVRFARVDVYAASWASARAKLNIKHGYSRREGEFGPERNSYQAMFQRCHRMNSVS